MSVDLTPCSVQGCERPVIARGWCGSHYALWRKNGVEPTKPIRRYARARDFSDCAVDGCGRPQHCRGWCGRHYECWRRTGSPVVPPRQPAACSVEDCPRQPRARGGMCAVHRLRADRGLPMDTPRYTIPAGPCAVAGCDGKSETKRGWCRRHADRWRRTGDVGTPDFREQGQIRPGTPCAVGGCGREVVSRDYCNRHYKRWLNGQPLTTEPRPVVPHFGPPLVIQADLPCAMQGCERRARSRGLCQSHYHQQRRAALQRTA